MIGNDVVDLLDPESQPELLHPRFDRRVFAAPERCAIEAAPEPNRERWRLWAAKEAAYKLARRRSEAVVFSPIRFVVELGSASKGFVRHGCERFEVETHEGDGAVHAVARLAAARSAAAFDVLIGVRQIGQTQESRRADAPGSLVRAFVIERLAERLRVLRRSIEVRREGRVPRLWLSGRCAPVDLSLSHHGRFVAFACAWSPAALAAAGVSR